MLLAAPAEREEKRTKFACLTEIMVKPLRLFWAGDVDVLNSLKATDQEQLLLDDLLFAMTVSVESIDFSLLMSIECGFVSGH